MNQETLMSWLSSIWVTSRFPLALAVLFFISLYYLLVHHPTIFFKRHGRKHALTGLIYLIWISLGFVDLLLPHIRGSTSLETHQPMITYWIYDVVLGVLGTILTLYAAFEFQHKNIKNVASGTLDEHATVTYGEMIEHSFYQALNLIQILFIHSMTYIVTADSERGRNSILTSIVVCDKLTMRLLLLFLVTLPWLIRDMFPINRFSDNYTKIDHKSTALIRWLYRIKKYQYVFYKHFLLHGLNISIAVTGIAFGDQHFFRLYWLLLNLSYVMEFFLQTLVKKGLMKQQQMLFLQKVLMTASTIAAVCVLRYVNVWIALISLIYNFINRKHDVYNTMTVCLGYIAFCYTFRPNDIVR
jgi:hypothetical protein